MIRWTHGAILCLACWYTEPTQAAETYDLIPADALGGVACKSIEGLVQKTTKLVKDAEIPLPEQPAALCKQLFEYLGITKGLDVKQGCSLVVVNKKHVGVDLGLRTFMEYLVIAVPFSDLDEMAGNYGFEKGKLKLKTIAPAKHENLGNIRCYAKGKHLYLGTNEKAVLSVAKGKSVGEELSVARRKYLAEADCLCHLGTEVWGNDWKNVLRSVESGFEHVKDDAGRKTVTELMESLTAVRHVFCTCKLDGGIGFGCLCVFPKEGHEAAKKFLNKLRAGDGSSSLQGLPTGNVVAATAARGDGSQNGHIARTLIDVLLRNALETNRVFGAADRPAVLATFNEIWPRLRGSRFALYKTPDERKLGLFSAVGILDVEDPEKFLKQLRMLAKLGSADGLDLTSEAGKEKTAAEIEALVKNLGDRRFQTRESATSQLLLAGEQVLPFLEKALKAQDLETSRRAERIKNEIVQAAEDRRKELLSGNLTRAVKPSFVFLDKTEKLDGFEVHQVGVKLKKADAATGPQLRQLLGPEWARVRIGVHGQHVVVLAGSDVKLLGEALRNLRGSKPGLASAPALGDQAKRVEAGRKLELHLSLAMGAALAKAEDLATPGKVPANPPLTTLALTVEEDRLQCDCWLPLAELKAIVKAAQ